MIKIIIGCLCGIGVYFILADIFRLPYFRTVQAVETIAKRQKKKVSFTDIWLGNLSKWLSGKIKMSEYRKEQLKSDIICAGLDITPEEFRANAIVKASVIGVLAIPVAFVFPILSPLILILAVILYIRESGSLSRRMKKRRAGIENELPRLVFTVEKTLKHTRDVLFMLDSYRESAGSELRHELDITVADMKSGNYEGAITRMESRIGSSQMSDVCRGLIGILRGDDTGLYWQSLSQKFSEYQRELLRAEAAKVPRKVNKLSMCLLVCFMLTYVVVILQQIVGSIGVLFG